MSGRTRRPAGEARRMILEAAAELLAVGGVEAVQVRAVAASVGMTDAGVSHHFGNRRQLLEALLRHGGRELRAALDSALDGWLDGPPDVGALVDALHAAYTRGFAELALAIHAAGWRDPSSGLLEPVVTALHRRRADPAAPIEHTRLAVAALHQAVALDAVYGPDFRRSAGIPARRAPAARPQLDWWVTTIEALLDPSDGG